MRAAIVIPTEWHAAAFSGDPRVLAGGFEAIGHSATIVCAPGSTYPPETNAITVDGDRAADPGWWRGQNFDLAVVFTWMHSHHGVIKGIAESDTFVISKGDTAGLYGARAHPRDTLDAAIRSADNPASATRNVWLWCKRFSFHSRTRQPRSSVPYQPSASGCDCGRDSSGSRKRVPLPSFKPRLRSRFASPCRAKPVCASFRDGRNHRPEGEAHIRRGPLGVSRKELRATKTCA